MEGTTATQSSRMMRLFHVVAVILRVRVRQYQGFVTMASIRVSGKGIRPKLADVVGGIGRGEKVAPNSAVSGMSSR